MLLFQTDCAARGIVVGFIPTSASFQLKIENVCKCWAQKSIGLMSQAEHRTIFVPLRAEALIAAESPLEALRSKCCMKRRRARCQCKMC